MPSELTPKQQWSEHVRNATSVLIFTHANPDGDAVGSTLALKLALEKLGKQVTVAAAGQIPEALSFLPQQSTLLEPISLSRDLLVMIDESQAKVGNISLKRLSDTKLAIVVTPKDGFLTPANLRIEEGTFNADLIIVLDSANIERLGALYEENPNLFYEVPVINIDHHPGNTNFGKVNIVDTTASSTAEVLVSLLETLGKDVPNIIDSEVATCLLTGIITDTGSFQNANTTPKSLTVAAQMVAAGGRQQEIIKHVFMTRTLSTLRLWGRALSYIKEDRPLRFAWSVLTKADFVAAQAGIDEASGVVDQLLKSALGMDFVILLTERDGGIHGSFRSINPTADVSKLAALFGGGGHVQAAAFQMPNASLATKENEIISLIRDHLTGATRPQPTAPSTPTTPAEPSTQPAELVAPSLEPAPPVQPAEPQSKPAA